MKTKKMIGLLVAISLVCLVVEANAGTEISSTDWVRTQVYSYGLLSNADRDATVIGRWPGAGQVYRTYLKYNLNSISVPYGYAISSAVLSFRVDDYGEGRYPSGAAAHFVANDTWAFSLTNIETRYTHKPADDPEDSVVLSADGTYTLDVTDLVVSELAGDKVLSIALTGNPDTSVLSDGSIPLSVSPYVWLSGIKLTVDIALDYSLGDALTDIVNLKDDLTDTQTAVGFYYDIGNNPRSLVSDDVSAIKDALDPNVIGSLAARVEAIENWINAAPTDSEVIRLRQDVDLILRALMRPGASGISGQGVIKP